MRVLLSTCMSAICARNFNGMGGLSFIPFVALGTSLHRKRGDLMKTLKLRIVVTFTLALIGSSLAMLWVSASITHRFTIDFFEGSMKLQLQQAQKIYEGGGPGRLAQYLEETDAALTGKRYLTDASGQDLVSGVERSYYLHNGFGLVGFANQKDE